MKNIIKPYKKDLPYSYTAGAYTTIELLKVCPERAEMIIIHSAFNDVELVLDLCNRTNIPIYYDDKIFRRFNQKKDTYVLGMFTKCQNYLASEKPHVVLVNPSDMGNLGTIIRTLAGLNYTNLAIITPAADVFHPKTIRASMGAVFHMNIEHFPSFEQYRNCFGSHSLYPFMLDGREMVPTEICLKDELFSLIFGNEATGLPDTFKYCGTCVKLPQTAMVDSLNLSVAVGIGAFIFASNNGQL